MWQTDRSVSGDRAESGRDDRNGRSQEFFAEDPVLLWIPLANPRIFQPSSSTTLVFRRWHCCERHRSSLDSRKHSYENVPQYLVGWRDQGMGTNLIPQRRSLEACSSIP